MTDLTPVYRQFNGSKSNSSTFFEYKNQKGYLKVKNGIGKYSFRFVLPNTDANK